MSELRKRKFLRPSLDWRRGRVEMNHGSGGLVSAQLVEELFLDAFDNEWLRAMNDQASFNVSAGTMVISTDSHVISPLFFPGGDIGCLSVYGTINDIAMSGARPLYLTAGFILEEGFLLRDLRLIVRSMAKAAKNAGVAIVAGDTKVVEQGKGDGVFINTTGIGVVPEGIFISADQAKPGDRILLSGSIGDHGIAVLSKREDLQFETTLLSDTAPLHDLVAQAVGASRDIHCLRDPTRGGVATVLNEIAKQSGVGMRIREAEIPVRPEVKAACEFLGLDPLYVANEGKCIVICPSDIADHLLGVLRRHPLGKEAAIIGEVVEDPLSFVEMETIFGGNRVINWLTGEQLPRIC